MTNDAGFADPRSDDDEGVASRAANHDVVVFGEFTAHLRTAELFRGGSLVKLQLQPFRVLAALLRRPGELLTRDELRREVWGEHTAVDFEHGLNFCIKQVRVALGDSADDPSFIETLPRRGYRFIAHIADRKLDPAAIGPPDQVSSGEPAAELPSGAVATAAQSSQRWRKKHASWFALTGAVLVVIALAAIAWRRGVAPHPKSPEVLFVVPFENLTGDRANDIWCDGLTEEIIALLASADPKRIHVIARTTSMAYRGARKSLGEIGREVKADLALEGAVRKSGDRLRVTTELYRLDTEASLGGDAFETTETDVLSVQRLLAARLAAVLALTAHSNEGTAPTPAMQEALAKARYLRQKNDPESMVASVAAFEEAVRLGPENATAWSEMALAYEAAAGILPAAAAIDKSCAAAIRARELSSREALGDTALGLCALQRDWDWAGAESAFGSSIAKNPGLAVTHHVWAAFLSAAGRHPQAVAAIERAKRLDPLSPAIVADAGWHAYLARDFAAAVREFERTLELEPKDAWSREHLMTSRALAGDSSGAMGEARIWAAMFPLLDEDRTKLAALAPADVVRGTSAAIAESLAARAATERPPNPGFVAAKFAGGGRREEALTWLERAAAEHAPWFLPLLRDPRFDFVRHDPRFAAIVERVHLPD